jgi:hypothetical protein
MVEEVVSRGKEYRYSTDDVLVIGKGPVSISDIEVRRGTAIGLAVCQE